MKIHGESLRAFFGAVAFTCILFGIARTSEASETKGPPPTTLPGGMGTVESWWNGKAATGEWFGVRPSLEERGVAFSGLWKGYFYLLTGGGLTNNQTKGAFDEEIKLKVNLDLEKLFGISGLSADADVRWRDGKNVNEYVGASSGFDPSPIQSGRQWRMGQAYLTWKSGDLFVRKDLLTISGGWQNPYTVFGQQPLSKMFTNNVIVSSKGIGLNGIPWSSSYLSWGGYVKIQPTPWAYSQSGLYVAIPGATSTANHGLFFAGANPPDSNGLFFLAEAGVTPRIGPDKLEGKYAAGFIYYGLENQSFNGATYDQRWSVYFQADQMLYREPSFASDGGARSTVADGKSFQQPVSAAKPKLSKEGLYWINWFSYAPGYDNVVPFYFHTGFVYEGLIPTRDKDRLGVIFGSGSSSEERIRQRRNEGFTTQDTMEAVVEVDYYAAVNRFVYIKPFWQYLIRPNADGQIPNANVFGMEMGVTF